MPDTEILGFAQALNIPCIALERDGRIIAATKSAAKLLGQPPEALLGAPLHTFCSDDESKIHTLLQRWLKTRNALPGVVNIKTPDGQENALRCTGVRYQPQADEPARIVMRCESKEHSTSGFASLNKKIEQLREQISRRRQAEAVLEQLVSGTAAVTGTRFFTHLAQHLATALDVKFALIAELDERDPAWVNTLAFWQGDKNAESFKYELEGTPCSCVYKDGSARYLENVQQAFPQDQDLKDLDIESYVGVSLLDEKKLPVGHLCIMDDKPMQENEYLYKFIQIFAARASAELQRIQAQGALQRAHDELEERVHARTEELNIALTQSQAATKAKSAFLANMSHEIRTPMNGVLGMLNLLAHTQLNTQQRELLQTANSSAETLLTLLNDILDLSKIEAGRMDLESIEFDLRQAIEETVALFSTPAHTKHIELACDMDDRVPGFVKGDPTRLRQILSNLIGNAVKFTPQGEIFVRASLAADNAGEPLIRFDVADTGIGISAEAQGRIFESFTQADDSTTRHYGGTGLGLNISKQLAELMGGQIGLESTEGTGTTFWFTIRFEAAKAPAIDHTLPFDVRKIHILIVDDNATNRQVLSHHLSNWGIQYEEAENGNQALICMRRRALDARPFDLVLLDMMMPVISGLEVLEQIADDPALQHSKVIMLTSGGDNKVKKQAEELGASAWLIKPIRQSSLHNLIISALEDHIHEPTAEPVQAPPQVVQGNAHAILIAEDNKINQKVALGLLKAIGFEADVVDNGELAIEAARNKDYQLIFMDCQMPVVDGYEATQKIREDASLRGRVPIIAMTANAMQGDREKCLKAGMDDYIPKPINPEMIREKLEKWLKPAAENVPMPEEAASDK